MIATRHFRLPLFLCCVLYSALVLPADNLLGMNEDPIHDAARMGSRQDVEKILKTNPKSRDARTDLGATPLHYAAMNKDGGPLAALIAAGANVNLRDKDGRTPLHMAAFSTRTAHAIPLLQAGADPLLKTNAGRDVLSLARKVRADEFAGVVSIWMLKGCKPGKAC
ncbi:MAG: ankyrin repeat domain-containing protein [Sulfuritalea sp.]|nr:ankyrin repeat domain-containing protein [Sulfuritalea sp.]